MRLILPAAVYIQENGTPLLQKQIYHQYSEHQLQQMVQPVIPLSLTWSIPINDPEGDLFTGLFNAVMDKPTVELVRRMEQNHFRFLVLHIQLHIRSG